MLVISLVVGQHALNVCFCSSTLSTAVNKLDIISLIELKRIHEVFFMLINEKFES